MVLIIPMLDSLRTVSHAFGLMAQNALTASLERRAGKGFFGDPLSIYRVFYSLINLLTDKMRPF